jgi:hypothetical protein
MEKNNQYTTLVLALEDLSKKGYKGNFSVTEDCLLDDGKGNLHSSQDAKLMEFHRFEGETNPADSSILYVLKLKNGLKGTVVDSYGAQGSEITSEFMNSVKQKQFN